MEQLILKILICAVAILGASFFSKVNVLQSRERKLRKFKEGKMTQQEFNNWKKQNHFFNLLMNIGIALGIVVFAGALGYAYLFLR